MRIHTTLVLCLLAGCILSAVAQSGDTGDKPPAQFVPSSIAEALRELRYTAGKYAGWRSYYDLSSVTIHERGRSEIVGSFDESTTIVMMERNGAKARLEYLTPGGDSPDVMAEFDTPFLDPANARTVGTEVVTIGGKSYHATIVEFNEVKTVLGVDSVTGHRFWLVPGVPDGMARHDSIQSETVSGDADQAQRGESRSDRLTDLDVPFDVGGTQVHAYCINSDVRGRDGETEQVRQCFSGAIPGGMVHSEIHRYRRGAEVAYKVSDATDFERHTSPPVFAKLQPCSYPALLLEPIALEKQRKGDDAGAIRDFDEMAARDPKCPTIYNNRGNSKLNRKDYNGAYDDYSRAIALAPGFAEPYNNRGLVHYRLHHYDAAIAEFSKAVKVKPDFAFAYANRAMAELMIFKDNQSRRDYQKAIELNPDIQPRLEKELDYVRKSRRK